MGGRGAVTRKGWNDHKHSPSVRHSAEHSHICFHLILTPPRANGYYSYPMKQRRKQPKQGH